MNPFLSRHPRHAGLRLGITVLVTLDVGLWGYLRVRRRQPVSRSPRLPAPAPHGI